MGIIYRHNYDSYIEPHYASTHKVTEGISGQQGISGHGPSFHSLGAVFDTALESSKVGYPCALTIVRQSECEGHELP